MISAAAGFLLSPLAALLLILFLGRSRPEAKARLNARPGPITRFLLLSTTIAFPVGLLGAGVGWLLSHFLPNIDGSQNLARNLALIGMMLSPLAALGVMFFQSRRPGGAYDPASKSSKRWILLSQLAMVILVVLGKSWLVPVTPSSDSGKTLIGRAKFDFEIPQTLSGGWGAELPVFKGQATRWFPPNGQPVQMKDGRTLYFRVMAMALANEGPDLPTVRPKLFVGISEDAKDWSSESVELAPSRRGARLDLDHGVKAILRWNPSTGSEPEAGSQLRSAPSSNPSFPIMAVLVVLLLLIGGIVVIVRLFRSSRSAGNKALGIGCTVLLLGGLLLGLVPATIYFSFRNWSIESAKGLRAYQDEELAGIADEAERRSKGMPEAVRTPPVPESITVTVSGAVAWPGKHALRPDATLLDALAAAGGWTDDANLDRISIHQGVIAPSIKLRDILEGRAPNPVLNAGNRVLIVVHRRNP
jgi:hypothetical protein